MNLNFRWHDMSLIVFVLDFIFSEFDSEREQCG